MYDLVVTLNTRPSKPNKFICHLNYIINQSLVKFRPLVCKTLCKQDARQTDTHMHGSRLGSMQPENIMPLTHLSLGRDRKTVMHVLHCAQVVYKAWENTNDAITKNFQIHEHWTYLMNVGLYVSK